MSKLWIDPTKLYKTSKYITHDPQRPVRFVQVFQSIPALEPFYTEYEKNFDVSEAFRLIRDNKWLPIIAVILYLSFLVEGKKYIERRQKNGLGAVKLGYFPAAWNLFLAIFSILGAIRVVPHFLFLFTHKDFQATVCEAPDKVSREQHTSFLPSFLRMHIVLLKHTMCSTPDTHSLFSNINRRSVVSSPPAPLSIIIIILIITLGRLWRWCSRIMGHVIYSIEGL